MSTADRPAASAATASDVVAACRDADFVRIVATADGDALAAAGVLAHALDATNRPFQASVVEPPTDVTGATEADVTITFGQTAATADCSLPHGTTPLSETAHTAASDLAGQSDPLLAMAGATTSPAEPSNELRDAVTAAGAERRPGVAVPTGNVADGLAHSTLVHTPLSGDADTARKALVELGFPAAADPEAAPIGETGHRRIASMLTLQALKPAGASARAAEMVERVLRPHAVEGPFETVGGYGDVLDAVARVQPGTGVALALGHDTRTAALDAWRTHSKRAHRTLRTATTGRYDGLFVARASLDDLGVSDASAVPVGTVARLLGDFRSPEPVALFVVDGRAAATAPGGQTVATPMEQAAASADGRAVSASRCVQARFEDDAAAFIMAVREAL